MKCPVCGGRLNGTKDDQMLECTACECKVARSAAIA